MSFATPISRTQMHLLTFCLLAIGVMNISITFIRRPVESTCLSTARPRQSQDGVFALPPISTLVEMTVEDTAHFGFNDSRSDEEWDSISPHDNGPIFLGSPPERYMLTMFHQLHCLRYIHSALQDGELDGHTAHCLNALRQLALCHADTDLMPAPRLRPGETEPRNYVKVCKDWTQVYDIVEQNKAGEKDWLKRTRIVKTML